MIELPEAVVLAGQINSTLTGKRIETAIANQTPHAFAWYSGDPANYPYLLAGKTIQNAEAFGNHIEISVDDMLVVISTPIKYHGHSDKPPKKHQLLLGFSDGTSATCTVQMWGVLFCFKADEPGGMPDYHIAKQKPSPLAPPFDLDYFHSLFNAETGSLSAKEFLATKQRIPGLGNGVLQDILWTARIHPKHKMETLAEEQVATMHLAVKHVLHEMTMHGGRDTERDLFGCTGGYRTILSKNTVGSACPRCHGLIQKQPYLGGSIYICEGCQK